MDLILKESESRPNVKFKYFCNYEGGGIYDFGQGIFQFPLDPAVKSSKPSTSIEGKGAVGNVKPKSLSQYMRDSRFKNFPQLLIVNPQRQTSWKQHTHASYQELHFEEDITLKPHADNIDQEDASYTLIAFSLFDEKKGGQGHYTVYCKNGNKVWYLFDDDKTTKKGPNIEGKHQGKEKLFARVTSLYYLKNEEARDYDDVEEISTSTVFAVEDSQMKADEGATNKKTLDKEEKERLTQTKEHAEKKAEEKSTSTVFLVEDSQMKADEGATNKKKLDEEEKERLTQTKEHAEKKADEEATKNKADEEATNKKALEEKEIERLTAKFEKRLSEIPADVRHSLRGVLAHVDVRLMVKVNAIINEELKLKANAQMKEHMKDDEEATNKKASDEKEKNTAQVVSHHTSFDSTNLTELIPPETRAPASARGRCPPRIQTWAETRMPRAEFKALEETRNELWAQGLDPYAEEPPVGQTMARALARGREGLKADEKATNEKASEEKEKTTTEVMEGSIAEVEERLTVEVEETVGKVGEGGEDVSNENHMLTAPETINGAYISSPVQHNNILRSHQITFHRTISGG